MTTFRLTMQEQTEAQPPSAAVHVLKKHPRVSTEQPQFIDSLKRQGCVARSVDDVFTALGKDIA
jgi:hypothetical protein